jgi:multisubunit Na+/H+ antiporter MnhB subunit
MNKRRETSRNPIYSTQRGVVVGGAIGLYMGIFFRPSREPDLGFVFGLIVVATLVTVALRLARKTVTRASLGRETLRSFALYFFALLSLEGRHYVLNAAGPVVLVLFTTILGVLIGYIWVNFGGSVRNYGEAAQDEKGR